MSRLSRRESELAALVGEDVDLSILRQYLRNHHSNVTQAANAFFDDKIAINNNNNEISKEQHNNNNKMNDRQQPLSINTSSTQQRKRRRLTDDENEKENLHPIHTTPKNVDDEDDNDSVIPESPPASPLSPSCSPLTPAASPVTPPTSPLQNQDNHIIKGDTQPDSERSSIFYESPSPSSSSTSSCHKSALKPLVSLTVKPTSKVSKPFVKPGITKPISLTAATSLTSSQTAAKNKAETRKNLVSKSSHDFSQLQSRIVSLLQPCCQVWSEAHICSTLKQMNLDPSYDDQEVKEVLSALVAEGIIQTTQLSPHRRDDPVMWLQPLIAKPANESTESKQNGNGLLSHPSQLQSAITTPQRTQKKDRQVFQTPSTSSSSSSCSHSSLSKRTNHLSGGVSPALKAKLGTARRYLNANQLHNKSSISVSQTPTSKQKTATAVSHNLQRIPTSLSPIGSNLSSSVTLFAPLDNDLQSLHRQIAKLEAEKLPRVDPSETERLTVLTEKWLSAAQQVLEELLVKFRQNRDPELTMIQLMRGLNIDSDMLRYDCNKEEFLDQYGNSI